MVGRNNRAANEVEGGYVFTPRCVCVAVVKITLKSSDWIFTKLAVHDQLSPSEYPPHVRF